MSGERYVDAMRRLDPGAYEACEATTHQAFAQAVETAIDAKLRVMEESRAQYRKTDDKQRERALSVKLANLPITVGAQPEGWSNGRADIKIRHIQERGFTYIIECKIWKGPAWHEQGMAQVLGYVLGRDRRHMVLEFFLVAGMATRLGELRAALGATGAAHPVLSQPIDHDVIPEAFVSEHAHASGTGVSLVHAGCDLHVGT